MELRGANLKSSSGASAYGNPTCRAQPHNRPIGRRSTPPEGEKGLAEPATAGLRRRRKEKEPRATLPWLPRAVRRDHCLTAHAANI